MWQNGVPENQMVDVAQLVRVTDCGSEGRGFESLLPPFKKRLVGQTLFLFPKDKKSPGSPAKSDGEINPRHKFADRSLRRSENRSERVSAAGGCGLRGLTDRQRLRYIIPYTQLSYIRR